jgi:uncharacterized protein YjbI with pentapeptide repeats
MADAKMLSALLADVERWNHLRRGHSDEIMHPQLCGVNLFSADLHGAKLTDADLTGATFQQAS